MISRMAATASSLGIPGWLMHVEESVLKNARSPKCDGAESHFHNFLRLACKTLV